MNQPSLILNAVQIKQRIDRIAYQIYEDSSHEQELIIAGISNSGYRFAVLLNDVLKSICPIPTTLIEIKLDKENPTQYQLNHNHQISDFKNKTIIIVDDVLNSGKTLIYGVNRFLHAPVKKIATLVLVDRNHKSFPVNADYVGLSLATTFKQHIKVVFSESGDAAYLQ